MEFLAPDNVAGQTLLRLVARGSSIIAELMRLGSHVPMVFSGVDAREAQKYAPVIFGFEFLENAELYESRISESEALATLDDEFRENHIEVLERFYQVFESIYRYATDLNAYIDELSDGVFVQHTLDGVLQNKDGRQLLAELPFLYGVMLLIADLKIAGPVREKMIVSYYRYKGASASSTVDKVIKLMANTGFTAPDLNATAAELKAAKKKAKKAGILQQPATYPVDFFARVPIHESFISKVVSMLRSSDVYNQTAAYPSPEHRSAALATQAGMLSVLLFFSPRILEQERAVMREIVDKHYSDNWVVSYYMGFTVDLSEAFVPFRAAHEAMQNTMEKQHVLMLTKRHAERVPDLLLQLRNYLTEGTLTEDYVVDNIQKLLNSLREFNITLRWFILHRTTTQHKLRAAILAAVSVERVLQLLMQTADFEFRLKALLKTLISSKEARWASLVSDTQLRMAELSEFFSGVKPLTRVKKDENLQAWFTKLATQIEKLDLQNPTVAGRKIVNMVQALRDVEEFHQIDANLQIKQFLHDTRGNLQKMLRSVNVHTSLIGTIAVVSDFSYAWEVLQRGGGGGSSAGSSVAAAAASGGGRGAGGNEYVDLMHERIEESASAVRLLRATFLKLVSILDLPLVRIHQCGSNDVESVAEYYSTELVAFVRRVLEVIPASMFTLLREIVDLKTHRLRELPMKLERVRLADFAQLDERYALAKATHRVSVFTDGILSMQRTLLGVIEVDPKQLLEDGIRRELVRQVTAALHVGLQFPELSGKAGKSRPGRPSLEAVEQFEARLVELQRRVQSFEQSFEYIQDYINLYTLKLWQEEFGRIVKYHVQQESNQFLKKKIYDWQSLYQSEEIPIPRYKPLKDDPSANFMGRLVRGLCRHTNPTRTIYVDTMQGWIDPYTGRELVGLRTLDLIVSALHPVGLAGADKLLCFMIVSDLREFMRSYRKTVGPEAKAFVADLVSRLHPLTSIVPQAQTVYGAAVQRSENVLAALFPLLVRVGHKQLLRRQLASVLQCKAVLESHALFDSLRTLNAAVLKDIRQHYHQPDQRAYPGGGNPLLPELAEYLDAAGLADPLKKIYVTGEPLEAIACLLFLYTLWQLEHLAWNPDYATLTFADPKGKRKGRITEVDGAPFVIGVLTLLKQFHVDVTSRYLAFLGQYVRSVVTDASTGAESASGSVVGVPPAVVQVLTFLEQLCQFGSIPRRAVEEHVPPYLFDSIEH